MLSDTEICYGEPAEDETEQPSQASTVFLGAMIVLALLAFFGVLDFLADVLAPLAR